MHVNFWHGVRGDGCEVTRLAAATFHETLSSAAFKTGDAELDGMLEGGGHKFLNRDLKIRRESLERLWDAWERLKTLEPGKDKKAKVTGLLDRTSKEMTFRRMIEDEAIALTNIGNGFLIRHTEVGKVRSLTLAKSTISSTASSRLCSFCSGQAGAEGSNSWAHSPVVTSIRQRAAVR